MSSIKHSKIEDIPVRHKCEHEGYEYLRRRFVPFGEAKNTLVMSEYSGYYFLFEEISFQICII